jgi:hypothetical protein
VVANRLSGKDEIATAPWFRGRAAWRFVTRGYLPWLAATSVVWEVGHAPLYTLWREASPAYLAFAIAHCTLGDILIGTLALLLALVVLRQPGLGRWQWGRIAALTAALGVAYTVFSEWMNVTLFRSWTYAGSMPTLDIGGFRLGLTPIAQWLVVPALSLFIASRIVHDRAK